MKVSRADFLKTCGAALLGPCVDAGSLVAAAGAFPAAEASFPRSRFRLDDASAALFRQHLKSTFSVRSMEGRRVPLVLAGVIEQPIDHHIEQFSLIFHSPAGVPVPGGIHAFRHGSPEACIHRSLSPRR